MKKRVIRKYGDNGEHLDIPNGYTCGNCKEFEHCKRNLEAVSDDQTCIWIPSKFALPGQKSQADLMMEREKIKYEQMGRERKVAV